jgi:hypothetical protein
MSSKIIIINCHEFMVITWQFMFYKDFLVYARHTSSEDIPPGFAVPLKRGCATRNHTGYNTVHPHAATATSPVERGRGMQL